MDRASEKSASMRNSSFELLRIVSIFMIVLCHFATHGSFGFAASEFTVPRFWWYLIEMGGNLGASCFVLISGYFLSENADARLSARHVFKLLGQMIFCAVSIYLILCAVRLQQFSLKNLIRTFFPVTNGVWWFASAYTVLYLIHPFINRLIHALSRRAFRNMIMGCVLIWSIIPTITQHPNQYNHLIWFFTLYVTAGYIRMYGLNPKFTLRSHILFFALFSLLQYASAIIIALISVKVSAASPYILAFYERNSPLTLLSAISLFMIFKEIRLKPNRAINTIASASFGVYLMHEHPALRGILWTKIFRCAAYQHTAMIIPYSIFAAVCIFAVCTAIDLARQYLLERPYLRIVDRYAQTWLKPFKAANRAAQRCLFGDLPEQKEDK